MNSSTNPLLKLDSNLLSESFAKEKIHTCLISIDNTIVYQFFKNKKMEKKQHKINSCTKSVTSCLIGIAWEKGHIPDVHAPIIDYFPSLLKDPDQRKHLITIDHLLTMTAGFDWPEMGEWGKKRLLSEEWIACTTNPEHLTYSAFGHYGRHWWVSESSHVGTYYFAMGLGGQYCCIIPSFGMNITITSDTYGDTVKPLQLIQNILLQ